MKTIRRRIDRKRFVLIFGFLLTLLMTTIIVANVINLHNSRAAAVYMTATITDDNGLVDFSQGIDDAVANFSYTRVGSNSADSNICKNLFEKFTEWHERFGC